MRALFDSDVLIDYLSGLTEARNELAQYSERLISIITCAEVLIGADNEDELRACRECLADFTLIDVGTEIAEEAVRLRREHRLKLPDALIWATAMTEGLLLVTRNTKDFPENHPGIRVPYLV